MGVWGVCWVSPRSFPPGLRIPNYWHFGNINGNINPQVDQNLAGLEVFWARRYFGLCCGLVNNLKPFLLSASELMLACSRSFRPSVVSPQESSFLWFEFDGHELVVYHEAVLMYHSRQVWGVWGGLG